MRKRPDEVQTLFDGQSSLCSSVVVMTSIGVALDFWNKLIGYQLSPVKIIFLVMFVSLNKAFMQLQAIYMGMNRVLENSISHFLISVVFFILLLIGYFALIDVDRIDILLLFNLIGLACSVLYLAFRNRWGNWYKELNIKQSSCSIVMDFEFFYPHYS